LFLQNYISPFLVDKGVETALIPSKRVTEQR